jgi:hypothetical protein
VNVLAIESISAEGEWPSFIKLMCGWEPSLDQNRGFGIRLSVPMVRSNPFLPEKGTNAWITVVVYWQKDTTRKGCWQHPPLKTFQKHIHSSSQRVIPYHICTHCSLDNGDQSTPEIDALSCVVIDCVRRRYRFPFPSERSLPRPRAVRR